jgi:hypothetical protein
VLTYRHSRVCVQTDQVKGTTNARDTFNFTSTFTGIFVAISQKHGDNRQINYYLNRAPVNILGANGLPSHL